MVVPRRAKTSTQNDIFTGRVQFQPEIAVDPVTGTVVLSWRDGRDDAARARVATYLTTSIDGGQTFQRPDLCQSRRTPPLMRSRARL